MDDNANPYIDEWGRHIGYCNFCGDEYELSVGECPEEDDGEIVPYDDDPDPEA